jgi:hypothetical protein
MRKVQKAMGYPLYSSCKVLKIYGLTVRIRVLDVLTFDRVSLYKLPVNLLECSGPKDRRIGIMRMEAD